MLQQLTNLILANVVTLQFGLIMTHRGNTVTCPDKLVAR
jgi:hypothetical protein